jgi:uncharacterized protein (DUF697 family)
MAAAIPEIATIMRNQIAMIYDIGMEYGKKDVLTKELLAGVMMTALGAGGGTLLVMQGGKVLVKRAALRVFQKVIALLAGRVTQQVLKSMISKWVPIVGAAAMAAWSNYLTKKVGRKAIEIFEKDIVLSEENITELPVGDQNGRDTGEPVEANTSGIEGMKVKALINLVKIDGKSAAEESGYIHNMIEKIDIPEEERAHLLGSINNGGKHQVDFEYFAKNPDEGIGLLVDMVGLAKRDGEFHISEKMYIKQAGKLMGFSLDDIEDAMASID